MESALHVKAAAYVPSWANKPAKTAKPAAPSRPKSGDAYAFQPPPPPPPAQPPAQPPTRSPVAALRYPTRMSPVHVPFPPVVSSMNPDAKDFVPHAAGLAASALTSLPTSTAEIAEEKQRQQLQEQKGEGVQKKQANKQSTPPASLSWTAVSTKNNSVQPAHAAGSKSGLLSPAAPMLVDKSEEDIVRIGTQSKLKADASSFLPSRTIHRNSIVKPSPLTLQPTSADGALTDPWCLYYLPLGVGESVKETTYDPIPVFHVHNVPTFWKVFNNIPEPHEMQVGVLYLFRSDNTPRWEDPRNRDGGIMRFKVDSKHINDAWFLLLARTIGESWDKKVRDTVNGVVLKVREWAYYLEVWVARQTEALEADIKNLFNPLLGDVQVQYKPHTVVQERAAAALAEKEKTDTTNSRR